MKTLTVPPVVHDFFSYDRETGHLTHKRPGLPRDRQAGYIANTGYRMVRVNGVRFSAHRVIWFMVTGEQAPGEIDHVNLDKTDNRLCNLRLANRAQNSWNRRAFSAFGKGACWDRNKRKFVSRIVANGERIHLGTYATAEEARAAYKAAAIKYHGEFARIE